MFKIKIQKIHLPEFLNIVIITTERLIFRNVGLKPSKH